MALARVRALRAVGRQGDCVTQAVCQLQSVFPELSLRFLAVLKDSPGQISDPL